MGYRIGQRVVVRTTYGASEVWLPGVVTDLGRYDNYPHGYKSFSDDGERESGVLIGRYDDERANDSDGIGFKVGSAHWPTSVRLEKG